jgi:hypothetical protein
MAGRLGELAG